ncbi:MAG TPA: hypothetical protein DDZ89_00245 [Clostridiales bacterium]|nr:hypothetical protein [Clostridiales bacterium]
MSKQVLIVRGGWTGHEPVQVSEVFSSMLKKEGFQVTISETLDSFLDLEMLKSLHMIVPIWTMGKITGEQVKNVSEAVAAGTAIAGCHGGMCDAFRESVEWQFITGGNWVSHPGGDGVEYIVQINKASSSSIVEGIDDFIVKSEQYYLHVDPAVDVLATTRLPVVNWYHASNGYVNMPVLWTKKWGFGRVFYSSLGHHADIFDIPEAYETMRRGFLWAAAGKDIAVKQGLSTDQFKSEKKMF